MNDHKKACELGEAALTEALEKIDDVDEETIAQALVEDVTDYTGWCVCSLDFVHVLNTH